MDQELLLTNDVFNADDITELEGNLFSSLIKIFKITEYDVTIACFQIFLMGTMGILCLN